jgi:hypothetical protein
MLTAVRTPHVVVAAFVVDPRCRITLAFAKALENRPGPPMEMRVDNVHGKVSCCSGSDLSSLEGATRLVNAGAVMAHGNNRRFLQ